MGFQFSASAWSKTAPNLSFDASVEILILLEESK